MTITGHVIRLAWQDEHKGEKSDWVYKASSIDETPCVTDHNFEMSFRMQGLS